VPWHEPRQAGDAGPVHSAGAQGQTLGPIEITPSKTDRDAFACEIAMQQKLAKMSDIERQAEDVRRGHGTMFQPKRIWEKLLENPIDIAALLASITALGVSVTSCVISQIAEQRATMQFRQERQLVLTGKFQTPGGKGTCSSITAVPISQDFKFQEGSAHLPPQLYDKPIPIANNGDFLHMGSVCFDLQTYTKTKIPAEKGSMKIGQGQIPLIIKSFYAVKGDSYTDVSLYVLDTMLIVYEEESDSPSINFDGLSFVQRFPSDAPLNLKLLDELASSPNGFYLKPKAP
jgi:hypothetical protein